MKSGIVLYALTVSFAGGVALASLFHFSLGEVAALLAFAAAACAAFRARPAYKTLLIVALVLAGTALGAARMELFKASEPRMEVSPQATADVVGVVSAEPEARAANEHVVLADAEINGSPVEGKILAEVPLHTDVSYGDQVVVRGAVQLPESFAAEGGRTFDYPDYLRVRGIYAVMPRALVESVSDAHSPSGWEVLFGAKRAFERSLEKIFPEPMASVTEGILLGDRKALPDNIENVLVAAGLIHIVILAGYALSLVSQGVLDALSWLSPKWRYALAALLLVAFVCLTGGAATTVRACAMACIAMFARYAHRTTVAMRSLSAVLIGMLVWNPLYLLFDESFIISFLATFGLIALAPLCEKWLSFLPAAFDARGIASSTLAVQLFALPALLYFTGTLSLYALPANLLALPALPLAMAFGFFSGLLGFASHWLALLPAMLTVFFVHWMLFIAHIASSLPLGSSTVPAFPLWLMLAAYAALFAVAIRTYRRSAG